MESESGKGGAQRADHDEVLGVFSFKMMMRHLVVFREGMPFRPTIWWGQGCQTQAVALGPTGGQGCE